MPVNDETMPAERNEVEDFDEVGAIMAYEPGNLNDEGTIELFHRLVNSGLAFRLQGHYGRMAMALIKGGYISEPA
jgi:hypothetical protein